eukprot:30052_4
MALRALSFRRAFRQVSTTPSHRLPTVVSPPPSRLDFLLACTPSCRSSGPPYSPP